MSEELSKNDLEEIAGVLSCGLGADVSVYSDAFLSKSIKKRMTLASIEQTSDYRRLLAQDIREAKKLIDSLNINYSTFFRSQLSFSLLEAYILPSFIDKKRKTGNTEIRIWSAGCASGEEAYSIAILLDELNLARDCAISFRIFGTDISRAMLDLAKKGIYGVEALSNVRQSHIRSYFTSEGENYAIISRLKECINFSIYDLLEKQSVCPPPSIYGEFDIIICSNLLFYYSPGVQDFVLKKLAGCLADGGYLITGEAERTIVEKTKNLRSADFPNTIFKKCGSLGRSEKEGKE